MNRFLVSTGIKSVILTLQGIVDSLDESPPPKVEEPSEVKEVYIPKAVETYNIDNIRTLLENGFDEDECRRFVTSTYSFRGIRSNLSNKGSKGNVIDLIIEHAEQKVKMDEVLTWAKTKNPNRYGNDSKYFK